MEKEFAGGNLFDRRESSILTKEEDKWGDPRVKNPYADLDPYGENPFLQNDPVEGLKQELGLAKPQPVVEEVNMAANPVQTEKQKPEKKEEKKEEKKNKAEAKQETKPANQPEQSGVKETTQKAKGTAGSQGGAVGAQPMQGGAGGQQDKAAAIAKKEFSSDSTEGFMQELAASKPSDFIQGMQQAPGLVPQLEAKEKQELKESLPEIEKPTGLPTTEKAGKKEDTKQEQAKAKEPEIKNQGEAKPVKMNTEHQVPQGSVVQNPNLGLDAKKNDSGDAAQVKALIKQLPTNDNQINTNPGPPPKVELNAEADPKQNEENKQKSDDSVKDELHKAADQVVQDFGENNVYPEVEPEMLSPKTQLQDVPQLEGKGLEALPEADAEVLAAFDAQAKQMMDEKVGVEKAKQEEAFQKMQLDSEQTRQDNEKKIEAETESIKAQQEAEQQKAQAEVTSHRESWQAENQKVTETYQTESAAEKARIEGDINKEVTGANKQVEGKFADAQKQAESEKAKAQQQAKGEKNKAENQDKSFWEKAKDAVSDFFAKVKEVINKIFTALRDFVKRVIEAAKKFAKAIIDMARKAIVKFIKIFGEILKKLVSIVLFAFPELAKKFNALIDKAVNLAVAAVNKLADLLKKAVSLLLDALGTALDMILAAYQKLYNMLISALEFIAVGLLEILDKFANIVEATKLAFSTYFVSSITEEALGADVFSPLPNIERTQEEDEAFKAELAATQGATQEPKTEEERKEDEIVQSDKLDDSQIALPEGPAPFNPAFFRSLPPLLPGQSIELGGSSDPITREELQDALFNDGPVDSMADKIYQGSAEEMQDNKVAEEPVNETPDWWNMSDDQKLDHYIKEMGAEPAAPSPEEAKQQTGPEQVANVPLVNKTSPLSVGQRLAFTGRQMMKGMQVFWQQNKEKILLGILGGLLALGIAALLGGPAGVMLVIQIAMQALTIFFVYEAIQAIAGHLKDYIQKSISGDPHGGGKSLATALAVLISEFLFEYVMKGVGKVLKRIKKGMKSNRRLMKTNKLVRAARKANVAVKKTKKKVKGWVKKGGKIVMAPLNKAYLKGAKTVGELKEKFNDFRLKRMWLKKKGKYTELWGEFNPKILLMREDGSIDFEDFSHSSLEKSGDALQIGKKINGGGVVVSNEYLNYFNKLDDKAKKEALEKLSSSDEGVRRGEALKGSKPDYAVKADYTSAKTEDFISPDVEVDNSIAANLADKRKEAVELRDSKAKGSDDYNKENKDVIDYSEQIGEESTHAHLSANGYERIYKGSGAYNFDSIYKKDGVIYVAESKGGGAGLGGKFTGGEGGKYVQQGTRPYLEKTIADLESRAFKKRDKELLKLSRELRDALQNNKIKYVKCQQHLSEGGNLDKFVIKEFKI